MDHVDLIHQQVWELIERQKLGVLSTYGQGQPYASLVAFAGTADLKQLVFATPETTRKLDNLVQHPQVALLVDSSTNQNADFHEAAAVTATGTALVVEAQKQSLVDIYLAKHPHLKDFVMAPTTAFVCIHVQNYYLVKRFQNVIRLEINKCPMSSP